MTRDELALCAVVVAFAALVTVHVTIAIGLSLRPRRWRALVGFLVPPLAPYWGLREKMWIRSAIWIVAAVAYGLALAVVSRLPP